MYTDNIIHYIVLTITIHQYIELIPSVRNICMQLYCIQTWSRSMTGLQRWDSNAISNAKTFIMNTTVTYLHRFIRSRPVTGSLIDHPGKLWMPPFVTNFSGLVFWSFLIITCHLSNIFQRHNSCRCMWVVMRDHRDRFRLGDCQILRPHVGQVAGNSIQIVIILMTW